MSAARIPRWVIVIQHHEGDVTTYGPWFDHAQATQGRRELEAQDGHYAGAWITELRPIWQLGIVE